MDAAHIIGHDQAPGTTHGDPGGYWDWEYYLALVNWDGDRRTRPWRVVVDTASSQFTAGARWFAREGRRTKGSPHPKHSWSKKYYVARPDAAAGADQSAWFGAVIPAYGHYDVSVWWPVLSANNPQARVLVEKRGLHRGTLAATLAQNSSAGRWRRTRALPRSPVWKSLGTLDCVAGDVIWTQVSLQSAARGQVVVDAVRIFRKG